MSTKLSRFGARIRRDQRSRPLFESSENAVVSVLPNTWPPTTESPFGPGVPAWNMLRHASAPLSARSANTLLSMSWT